MWSLTLTRRYFLIATPLLDQQRMLIHILLFLSRGIYAMKVVTCCHYFSGLRSPVSGSRLSFLSLVLLGSIMITNPSSSNTPPKRGAFILLEGVDRCGKTTQVSLLVKHLLSLSLATVAYRFPDRTTQG